MTLCLLSLIFALIKLHVGATFTASFLIGLSVFTRSNGVVGIGFILHAIAKSHILKLHMLISSKEIWFLTCVHKSLRLLFAALTESIICFVVSVVPFFIYQLYIYKSFCVSLSPSDSIPANLIMYGRKQGYHIRGDDPSPWCYYYLPLSYTYIQNHHWDVGFLRYYQIKQLPNFLLAFPIILISFGSCFYFFKLNPQSFYTLGLIATSDHMDQNSIGDHDDHNLIASSNIAKDVTKNSNVSENMSRKLQISEDIVVYVFHLLGLTLFGSFFMHFQVLTRFLCSSSPLLYWYCGCIFMDGKHKASQKLRQNQSTKQNENPKTRKATNIYLPILRRLHCDFIVDVILLWQSLSYRFGAVYIYCLVYCLVGTVMFCNFLPWTE